MSLLSWSVIVYRRHKLLHSPNPQHGITNTNVRVMINNRPLLTHKKAAQSRPQNDISIVC